MNRVCNYKELSRTIIAIVYMTLLAGVAAAQKQQSSQAFSLTGTITGRDTGIIVLWYPDCNDMWLRDTSIVDKGSFSFKGCIQYPSFAHLIGSNKDGNYANFYLSEGNQQIIVKENFFTSLKLTGSYTQTQHDTLLTSLQPVSKRLSKLITQYEKAKKTLRQYPLNRSAQNITVTIQPQITTYQSRRYQLIENFIQSHPASFVSATELLAMLPHLTVSKGEKLYHQLTPEIQESRAGKLVANELEQKRLLATGRENLKIGATLPLFAVTLPNGDTLNSRSLKTHYVLFDFWASWCYSCRKAMKNLKTLYKKYKPLGLEIISVSIDKSRSAWEKAIESDDLSLWTNLWAPKEMKAVTSFIDELPSQILVDRTGKIFWTFPNTSRTALNQWLKKYIK